MKTKIVIIVCIVCAALMGTVGLLTKQLKEVKADRNRIESNYFNANQSLDSIKDKNGELHYTVETLNLTKSELEKSKADLVEEVKNMKIKIKNLESVSNVEIRYVVKDSLIPTKQINDTTFVTERKDEWLTNSWKSTLTNNGNTLNISDYRLELKDSIITPVEFTKKGWWIFKKITGVKIHVKSKNPYSNIDRIEYVKVKK